ncbi:MAG: HU-CCDC81 and SPOR domain-containing protein [Prevotella nanceiensis]|uniref:HU domain-containing protein n=1 Tax=Hoylesella nanceiensis TaxID=425941 RepID=UPI001CB0BB95|nr:SPOR domain-containing protein [Hoylesella nanceiensis]MBF1432220.1 HU-CCDC81 and SPOR domain-containing protein [Hoylesella nanceiensis]
MIELERHIEVLLLNNDCVIIPNFGGFMVHHVEARYDEKDHIFLPPYRTLGFNPQLKMNDSLLAQSYIEAYDISYPEAIKRIVSEVDELNQILDNEGEYELNDIGTLHRNEMGSFDFVPCDAGILTPYLYGLSSFELESLSSIKAKRNKEVIEAEKEITNIPTGIQALEKANIFANQSSLSNKTEDEQEDQEKSIRISISMLRNAAAVAILFVVLMLIPTPLSNKKDKLIQSELNTSLLYKIIPNDVITEKAGVNPLEKIASKPQPESTKEVKAKEVVEEVNTPKKQETFYTIVLASRITKKNAEAYTKSLKTKGLENAEMIAKGGHVKVICGRYESEKEAYKAMNKLNNNPDFADCWVTKIQE